jgi:glycosyltransferase involved in cell wall biosynthesis
VLHILAPTREGGLERVVTMMAMRQMSDGVHVAAVLEPGTDNDHPFVARLEALHIPLTRIVVGARSYLSEYRSVRTLIRQLKPGVVHTHGYRADLIGSLAARHQRVPTVSTVHGFTGGSLRNRLNEVVQRFALRGFGAVIAVAAPIVGRLTAAGVPRSKIHCIPNGFTLAVDRLERSSARRKLGVSDGKLIAGWVGRLSREKGADVMLRALSRSDPAWHLSIIGEGPESNELLRLSGELGIGGRVTWHGAMTNAGSLFGAFDAFVLSSRTEGTPITLFEAMDARVPIVAASVGGVPDVISAAHAILVPPEQPDSFARALEEIQRNPAAAVERSARARERLISAFGASDWIDAVDAAYRAAHKTSTHPRS